jgi:membrane protease YdiL (CAAX protease family)
MFITNPIFILAAIALSVFVTWIFVNTGQNVFIAFLLHFSVNFTYTLIGSDPLYMSILQLLSAMLVFILFGKDLILKISKTK